MKQLVIDGITLTMDDDVFEFIKGKKIEFTGGGYPVVRLHTMFFHDVPEGHVVDHINRDKGDFRRENLRVVSYSTNNRNRTLSPDSTSRYRGVSIDPKHNDFRARILYEGRELWLGRHDEEEEAARAYDVASLYLFPDLEITNFPSSDYDGLDLARVLHSILCQLPKNNVSGFRGVSVDRRMIPPKWRASYKLDGRKIHLGSYDSPEEAAQVRDRFAREHGCPPSRLNFATLEELLRAS